MKNKSPFPPFAQDVQALRHKIKKLHPDYENYPDEKKKRIALDLGRDVVRDSLRLPRKIRNPYRHKISATAIHHLAQILDKTSSQTIKELLRHPPAVDVAVPEVVVKAAVDVDVDVTVDVQKQAGPTQQQTRGVDVRGVTDGEGRAVPPYQRRSVDGRAEHLERARVGEIISS